jgi:uncharacterized protein YcfL
MISSSFLQQIKLVQFSGGINYNDNGYAVLPSYTITDILASVQPASKSEIRFLPEGTHYADFMQILTDYEVDVDNTPSNLGDYFIYNNYVYKIYSAQNFKQFTSFTTNHIETMVARDNRIVYNLGVLNLPFPQIDSAYAPLFELIKMAASCFTTSPIPVLWGYQQELRPDFPMCMVNVESTKSLDATNYSQVNAQALTFTKNKSAVLNVMYKFYAYDKTTVHTLLEKFKMNFDSYTFTTNKIAFLGFSEGNEILNEELYENRTIFNGEVGMQFSLIVEQVDSQSPAQTIETATASLSFHN